MANTPNARRTALLSAYDKTGLDDFSRELTGLGFDLLGSRGTAEFLNNLGIKTRDVAEIVGKPILGHKVVTLSREIHAALLASDTEKENAELAELGLPRIDLVYVNLYPLGEELEKPGHTLASVLEKTDIGGPTMLRSAAKGRRIVLARPEDVGTALSMIRLKDAGKLDAGLEGRLLSHFTHVVENEISLYCARSSAFHCGESKGSVEELKGVAKQFLT